MLAVTNQHDLPRVPMWSRGSMILIGDAAHVASPTAGQGASLAIEDAIVLAQCLRDLPIGPALAAHPQAKRPVPGMTLRLSPRLAGPGFDVQSGMKELRFRFVTGH